MKTKNPAAVMLGRRGGLAKAAAERKRRQNEEKLERELNALRAKLARSLRKPPMAPKGSEG